MLVVGSLAVIERLRQIVHRNGSIWLVVRRVQTTAGKAE